MAQFRRRNKATERAVGLGVGRDKEGGLTKFEKGEGRQYRRSS